MASNFTVVFPEGTTNHGNPHLICTPPQWYDYFMFYFANYIAHAVTVVTRPGQGPWETITVTVLALLLPATGVVRACVTILHHAGTIRNNELHRAVRARALCMVVRIPAGKPVATEEIGNGGDRTTEGVPLLDMSIDGGDNATSAVDEETGRTTSSSRDLNLIPARRGHAAVPTDSRISPSTSRPTIQSEDTKERHWWELREYSDPDILLHLDSERTPGKVSSDTKIHGAFELPPGYELHFVPRNAPVRQLKQRFSVFASADDLVRYVKRTDKSLSFTQQALALPSNYSIPKIIVSLAQILWALTTLYRTRGDQIDEFGYAAYGLTVAPYAFSSVLNTVANLLCPEYPSVFMIRTPIMDAAEMAGGYFVGELAVELGSKPGRYVEVPAEGPLFLLGLLLSFIPFTLIAVLLRGFHPGNSSSLERGLTMAWLVIGMFIGANVSSRPLTKSDMVRVMILCATTYGVPAIGGLVIVGLQIRDYGICTLVRSV